MAKRNKKALPFFLGNISGKLGNHVYSSWRGKPYVRSVPKKSTRPPTQVQIEQRARFGLVSRCLHPARSLITIGFSERNPHMTELNCAMSYALKNAVAGSYPDYYIDFSKLLLTHDRLRPPLKTSAAIAGQESILFTWDDFPQYQNSCNEVLLIALCQDPAACIYTMGDTLRRDGFGILKVTGLTGKKVHTYLSFYNDNRSMMSDSIYTGEFLLPG